LPQGGFGCGELHPVTARHQNPHMHMFEAAIALASASSRGRDLQRANDLARFATTHLITNDGVLPEYFDENWIPLKIEGKIVLEPGHHFEWAWLLCKLAEIGGLDYRPLAEKMWRFANRHGVDHRRGVAIDKIGINGEALSTRARLWPQTERLKAAIAMLEYGAQGAAKEIERAYEGLKLYFATPIAGLYFDKMYADGTFENEPVRASSLYHIVCAISELNRVCKNQPIPVIEEMKRVS
jgi:mannose/cellobiose epimerase-like protein (N-acyl-D-glucosamine 2-epimerase family)